MEENASSFLCASEASCQRLLGSAKPSRVRFISLAIEPETVNVLNGAPGCGKNLLLRLLGLLETPDRGEVFFQGQPTRRLDDAVRLELRNRHFGFVFNEPFLLDSFSVTENVAMPLFKISRANIEQARSHTEELLDFIGLRERAQVGVSELSLLEQHKISLARALVNQPEILIVEDVDARLDSRDLMSFSELLQRAKSQFHLTVIMSALTSDIRVEADRAIQLANGKIAHDTRPVPAGGGAQE